MPVETNPPEGEKGIQLTPAQKDAVNELINIGFGRAASSLSMLINQRVLLNVPHVQVCALDQIGAVLQELTSNDLVNVHQVFRGKLSGHAMLLMDTPSAHALVDLMNGGDGSPGSVPVRLNAEAQEALTELGNIVINAFLGAFGNLLKMHITFTVPMLKIESLVQMLRALRSSGPDVVYAMVVKIRFQLSWKDVVGYMVVVMDANPVEALVQIIKQEGLSN